MGITLRKVLEFDIMREARVVSKRHNLDVPVNGITVIEAPDVAQWIDGNELILTNLFSVYHDATAMIDLVRGLSEKGVAALIIKVKRFVDEIPPQLLEEAEKLRLAVIEIPPHLRYMDIMYSVMASVFDNQVVHLSYFKQTYHQLTTLALKNCGITEIAETLSVMVDNPVLLYDREGRLLFESNSGFQELNDDQIVTHQYDDLRYYSKNVELFGEVYKELIIPIRLFNMTRANLCIIEKNRELSELDFIALQTAVTVLRLNLVSEHTRANTELKYRQEIIEDILRGINDDHRSLEDRARMLGWEQSRNYSLVIAEYDGREKSLEDDTVEAQLIMDSFSEKIKKRVESYLKIRGQKSIIGIKRKRLIIFIEEIEEEARNGGSRAGALKKRLDTFCEECMKTMMDDSPELSFFFGYTSEGAGLESIPKLYRQAQDAITIGKTLYGKNFFCDYNRLGVYKLLCSAGEREKLREFVPEPLWILREQEMHKPSGELLKTFECLLENGCNISKTAKELFVHYKTLNYRMQKIQQLTGINLKNTEELLEMQIGIKILNIIENTSRA